MVALSAEGMIDAVMHRLHLAEGCLGGDGLPILTPITFNTAIHACNQAKQVSKDDLSINKVFFFISFLISCRM